jgi:hypothetical protein
MSRSLDLARKEKKSALEGVTGREGVLQNAVHSAVSILCQGANLVVV